MNDSDSGIRDEIRQGADGFENGFERQDALALADLYTDGGMVLPTGSDFITGRDAIRDFWQGAIDAGVRKARLEIKEVDLAGDTAIDVGQYELSGADGQVIDRGKYIVIWKRERDAWKMHRDIWNSSLSA